MKLKINILWMLCIILLLCSSCSFLRNDNIPFRFGREQNKNPQNQETPQDKAQGGPETPEEPVEENINGMDIDKDEEITKIAEKENATQKDVGITQKDTQKVKDGNGGSPYKTLHDYQTKLPSEVVEDLKYDKYPISYDYVLLTDDGINIREKPYSDAKVVCKGIRDQKLALLAEVKGEYMDKWKNASWYEVSLKDKGSIAQGYIYSALAEPRSFRLDLMLEHVKKLKDTVDQNKMANISNYKNYHGEPPAIQGQNIDPYGYRRNQSAPGYKQPDTSSEFRYIPDGMLAVVLEEIPGFTRVRIPEFEGEYWVEKKYISFENYMETLSKVTVVDRKYQNQASFEYIDGKWHMVSYIYATTGLKGPYSFETPLGDYKAIAKRDKFYYLADGSQEIGGYAPYALRFSGGAYIHGVPVDYEIVNGEKKDPGIKEYLHTIGTIPRSHMCVRNYTSHAQFIYDWAEIGKSAVIVIE